MFGEAQQISGYSAYAPYSCKFPLAQHRLKNRQTEKNSMFSAFGDFLSLENYWRKPVLVEQGHGGHTDRFF